MKNLIRKIYLIKGCRQLNRIAFLSLMLLLFSSCSKTQIAYKFSDWFLLERVDHYFEITPSQEEFLEEKLEHLLSWHRTHEMPEIIITLTEFHERYRDGLDPADLDWLSDDHRSYFKRFFRKAIPDFSRFLATLDDSQIQHFKAHLKKKNDFLIKQANMTDEELKTDTREWFVELLEDWFGDLNREQKASIHGWLTGERKWVLAKLENRRKFQKDMVALLKERQTEKEIETQLTVWIEKPESRWTPEFKEQIDKKIALWKELLFKVDAIITPTQRNRALEKIQEYIDDFKTLTI
jgi:hypothetical protein